MELKKEAVLYTLNVHTPMKAQGEDRTPSLEAKQGAFLWKKCLIKNLLFTDVKTTAVLNICAVGCDSNSQAKKKNSCSRQTEILFKLQPNRRVVAAEKERRTGMSAINI